jgi:DNA-binding transcriptional ArsR family regulator
VLRFELEPADLLATRFETRPGPLEDVGLASRALRRRPVPQLTEWRRLVLPRLRPDTAVALLLQPPTGITVIFTGPSGYRLEDSLEVVRGTPKAALRDDVEDFVSEHGKLPAPLRGLADAESTTLRQIARGLRSMHQAAVSPVENQLELIRDTEVALRGLQIAREGLASAINDLHPTLRLRNMALEIDRPVHRTVRSSGQGIVLLPSPWLHDEVRVQHGAGSPIAVYYPARLPLRADPRPERSLGRLLGATRARLLAVLSTDPGPGTNDLAATLGISAPTASEHLGVLRDAQLITTHRGPTGATHDLTPTGRQLLGLNFAATRRPR